MKKYVLSFVLMLMTSLSWAQEVEKKPELKGEVSQGVNALKLATDLVKYGYEQQSALPLIQALQIIAENPTQPLKASREGTDVDTNKKDGKKGDVSLDFNEIVTKAKEFADGDEAMTALIAQIQEENSGSHRGAVNGPSRTVEYVNGNSVDTYQISFVAGYLAEILVSGDGDTDLDLYVYDGNGNLIAKDSDYSDDCYVSWVPAWTGRFIVKIVNRGPVYNKYVLLTN